MSDHACTVCGGTCHCGSFYRDHHCCRAEGQLDLSADSSGTCCVCGVRAGEARVQGGLCVSRGMCESRRRKRMVNPPEGLLDETKPRRGHR